MKKLLASVLVASSTLGMFTVNGHAEEVDEMWGSPTFVYGSALDEAQLVQTKEILSISNKDLEEDSVTGIEMVKYLGSGNKNARMFSSVLITHNDATENVNVEIVTPENITKVTQNQYSNALITAGAVNVDVQVASPVKVTGESALTGIYKAYEMNGTELDKDRMAVAQDELSTVTDISNQNKDNQDFNIEALNKAMIDVKNKMAELSNKGKDEVAEDVAKEAVKQIIKANGLSPFITDAQVDDLVEFAIAYSKTGAVSSKAVNEQLNDLASSVTAKAKEISDLGANFKNDLEEQGFFEKVKNAFRSMFESIGGWF